MPIELATFPAQPQDTQTVTLEATQYRIRLTWRTRCAAWYLDLYALDETPLALGVRVSAGWRLFAGMLIEDGPAGYLIVRGSDGYARGDLGDTLRILFYTEAELAAVQTEDTDAPIIEIA